MPNYALGQQVRKDDERIKASYETIPSPNGHGYIRGYFVRPFSADTRTATPAKLPGMLVIHENRGLNPHTEDVARRFALENFMAFAPDALTSVGGYPGDDYKGGQLFGKLDAAKRTQDFVAAARWLKARPDGNGKIGVTGFCFGGGMSNTLAGLLGADLAAAAPFYGGAHPGGGRARRSRPRSCQPRRAGPGACHGLPRPGGRAEEEQRPLRRPPLSELRARLLQRRHAGALQQGCGGTGLDPHDRLVQQVASRVTREPRSPIQSAFPGGWGRPIEAAFVLAGALCVSA